MLRIRANGTLLLRALLTFFCLSLALRTTHAAPAATPVTACGTVLSASGNYYLPATLQCNNISSPAIYVTANNVDLDLRGNALSNCTGVCFKFAGSTGVMTGPAAGSCLAVSGLHVHGGTIQGFETGVMLCSPNGTVGPSVSMTATVDHVNILLATTGIAIFGSGKNKIENNTITQSSGPGIDMEGSSSNDIGANLLDANGTSCVGCGAIFLSQANATNIHGNAASNTGNGNAGILTANSVNNTIQNNFFAASTGAGIRLGPASSGNSVKANASFDSITYDVEDDSAACVNSWSGNLFATVNPTAPANCVH